MQKDRDTLIIEQSLTIRMFAVTVLLEYLYFHICLWLQVSMAAGDYLLDFFCTTVVEQQQITFTAMGSHCQEHSYTTPIFCCSSKSILSCEFRICLPARNIITRLCEASVMFRTCLTVYEFSSFQHSIT